MTEPNKILFVNAKPMFLAFFLCIFLSNNAFSQGEREKNIQDIPKSAENASYFESPESSLAQPKNENSYETKSSANSNQTSSSDTSNKKDQQLYKSGGEKDLKKEGMSTLSFNLFLYMVDKFKED